MTENKENKVYIDGWKDVKEISFDFLFHFFKNAMYDNIQAIEDHMKNAYGSSSRPIDWYLNNWKEQFNKYVKWIEEKLETMKH